MELCGLRGVWLRHGLLIDMKIGILESVVNVTIAVYSHLVGAGNEVVMSDCMKDHEHPGSERDPFAEGEHPVLDDGLDPEWWLGTK